MFTPIPLLQMMTPRSASPRSRSDVTVLGRLGSRPAMRAVELVFQVFHKHDGIVMLLIARTIEQRHVTTARSVENRL